jgi:NTE family protein
MSMSIPIFFEPVKLRDTSGREHYIVDGGVLSNYPIWLLDDGTSKPPWPTFGFKLVEPDKRALKKADRSPIKDAISFLKALGGTMMDAHDNYHISNSKGDFERTIGIPTVINLNVVETEIRTTDFDITAEESQALFDNGVKVAKKFLAGWDFDAWVKKYRK